MYDELKRHPGVYICENACCFFSLCRCTKDMNVFFTEGWEYSYRKPTEEEEKEFGCCYIFFSNAGKYMIQYDELIEYF